MRYFVLFCSSYSPFSLHLAHFQLGFGKYEFKLDSQRHQYHGFSPSQSKIQNISSAQIITPRLKVPTLVELFLCAAKRVIIRVVNSSRQLFGTSTSVSAIISRSASRIGQWWISSKIKVTEHGHPLLRLWLGAVRACSRFRYTLPYFPSKYFTIVIVLDMVSYCTRFPFTGSRRTETTRYCISFTT